MLESDFFHRIKSILNRSQSTMLVACFLLHGIATAAIRAAQVGVIPYASLAMSSPAGTLTRATCGECLCAMFNSTGNASILSLNCHANTPSSVTCDMFTLGDVSQLAQSWYGEQLEQPILLRSAASECQDGNNSHDYRYQYRMSES